MALSLDESAIGSVVKFVRECNVTLHWLLLHTASPTILTEDLKRSRNFKQLVIQESKYTVHDTLRLLLGTAQIEYNIKQMYKQVTLSLLMSTCALTIYCQILINVFFFFIPSYCKIKRVNG